MATKKELEEQLAHKSGMNSDLNGKISSLERLVQSLKDGLKDQEDLGHERSRLQRELADFTEHFNVLDEGTKSMDRLVSAIPEYLRRDLRLVLSIFSRYQLMGISELKERLEEGIQDIAETRSLLRKLEE